MEDLQEGFVDVGLALEAVLDLVDVVYGVIELYGLVVLNGRPSRGPAEWREELHGRGARRGVRGDGRIALTAWCQGLGLKRLRAAKTLKVLGAFMKIIYFCTLLVPISHIVLTLLILAGVGCVRRGGAVVVAADGSWA